MVHSLVWATDTAALSRRIDRLLAPSHEDACVDEGESDRVGVSSEDEQLKNIIVCALDQVYPPPPPAPVRMRLLQFMLPALSKDLACIK